MSWGPKMGNWLTKFIQQHGDRERKVDKLCILCCSCIHSTNICWGCDQYTGHREQGVGKEAAVSKCKKSLASYFLYFKTKSLSLQYEIFKKSYAKPQRNIGETLFSWSVELWPHCCPHQGRDWGFGPGRRWCTCPGAGDIPAICHFFMLLHHSSCECMSHFWGVYAFIFLQIHIVWVHQLYCLAVKCARARSGFQNITRVQSSHLK